MFYFIYCHNASIINMTLILVLIERHFSIIIKIVHFQVVVYTCLFPVRSLMTFMKYM